MAFVNGNSASDKALARAREQAKAERALAEGAVEGVPSKVGAALEDELARLRAENQELRTKAASRTSISMKVSEKGALSVYGLGRFPITLYGQQWLRLLGEAETIKQFVADHHGQMAWKEVK